MRLYLKNKSIFLAFAYLSTVLGGTQCTEAKTVQKQKHSKYNKYCLVPPPPPYVPSMLPELSRYPGNAHSYSASKSRSSPASYSPNKYLTYYYPNKN